MFAAFPKPRRFLAEEQVLLVHERRMESSIVLNGPMKSCIQISREKPGLARDPEWFTELVDGSSLSPDELFQRATKNSYIHAREAVELGIVAGVLRQRRASQSASVVGGTRDAAASHQLEPPAV